MKIGKMVTLVVAAVSACGAQTYWSATTGVKYSSGKYGGDTDVVTMEIPLAISAINGNWSFGASTALMQLESEGDVAVIGGGMVPRGQGKQGAMQAFGKQQGQNGGGADASMIKSGAGDIYLNSFYTFYGEAYPSVSLGAIVKVATADEKKGLGTGEHDASAQISLFQTLSETTLSAYGGYTLTGDTADTTYEDIFYGSASVSQKLSSEWSVGALYYQAQPMIKDIDGVQYAGVFTYLTLGRTGSLGFAYNYGLNDATARQTLNATVSFYF